MIIGIALIFFIVLGCASASDSTDEILSDDEASKDFGILESQNAGDDILSNTTVATSLEGNNSKMYYGSGNAFEVRLSNGNGAPLINQKVTFTINGDSYKRATDSEGIASIKLSLNSGSYEISSSYSGTDIYMPCNAKNTVKILPTVSGNDLEKIYRNDSQYYATFKNSDGDKLSNVPVTFNINGVYYERKTNENGVAKMNINLNSGTYILTAINPSNGEMHSNTITVISSLSGSDITKYYRNDTQYLLSITNGSGEPSPNQMVTFNINGVFYERKSNENGVAKMNINLYPGNYTITATNPINGEMHSNSICVLPTIFAEDLNMIYRDGSRFTAKVIDGNGNALAGSQITFNVNGVFYNRQSNENGNAYLNINLFTGNYIITATSANGLSVSSKITISKCHSTIDASDAHLIAGIERIYGVTLYGVNGKAISSANVNFNYNGVSRNALTDENGEAKINIANLKAGVYTLEYEFKGDMNYYPFKSSVKLTVSNPTNILKGNDMKMTYNDTSSFKVSLTDLKSNPMGNRLIKFSLEGATFFEVTDANGVASLDINLDPGTYKITYSYGNVNDENYNQASNTITVSKIKIYLSTKDLTFNYGEKKAFTAVLTDSSKKPLEGLDVTFRIAGVTYTRTTNSSGAVKLNIGLNVGYYDIQTSFEHQYYYADSRSNHVLVNGTILTGNDLNLIPGLMRDYSVTLLNAYKKPVSNALIEFTYNGVTKRANTNAQGVATVSVGDLPKGSFPIVYKYVKGNNVGQSELFVSDSVLNSKNRISDLSSYLAASKNCAVSNSEIVNLAAKLTKGLTNPLDKAIAIYNYVRDEISYGYYYDTHYGSIGTLHAKIGNCVDQSHLSVALYRAAGLPARYVHGTCTFNDGDVTGHVWTQVLLKDTWVVSDTINRRNSLGKVVNWNNYNYNLRGYYSSLSF